ncbi:hypothetical protein CALCODRAFT_166570 [Calocera cornea HHB12733]|uniref:Uncharacterized protein n=1 Tax=Calocera cornea HHB12733 TaxID=1353952 RepID=A0A165HXM7_9BASI|nr:hypothetical protein CALCODRAFT_166570 [Calocera cornea HHB12733]
MSSVRSEASRSRRSKSAAQCLKAALNVGNCGWRTVGGGRSHVYCTLRDSRRRFLGSVREGELTAIWGESTGTMLGLQVRVRWGCRLDWIGWVTGDVTGYDCGGCLFKQGANVGDCTVGATKREEKMMVKSKMDDRGTGWKLEPGSEPESESEMKRRARGV